MCSLLPGGHGDAFSVSHGHACCRGHNIGVRLVDEFLAKAKMGRCSSFREAAEVIGRQAFPMFLNVTANVTNWSSDGNECSLVRLGLEGWAG